MINHISYEQAINLLNNLKSLLDKDDHGNELTRTYREAAEQGGEFEFQSTEEVTFSEDYNQNDQTELEQTVKLVIAGHIVEEWKTKHIGYMDENGKDWLEDEVETTIDNDLKLLLKELKIYCDTPEIPRPNKL
jgi:hypothetical protein